MWGEGEGGEIFEENGGNYVEDGRKSYVRGRERENYVDQGEEKIRGRR